jgi:hypothetical protein
MLPRLQSRSDSWLCAGVVLLAVLTVPQTLCLPLTADTQHYDIQADCALNGGVLYRDVLEPNLPGVVWVHMLVRSIAGWSSEVMRAFDLLMVIGIAILLCHCLNSFERTSDLNVTTSDALRVGSLMLLVWCCYVSLPEWCHCQRDIWMLLPALGAMSVRLHRCESSNPRWWTGSFVEGLLWGCAFWLKPFVAIPAICVWVCWTWQRRSRSSSFSPSPPLESFELGQNATVGEWAGVRGSNYVHDAPLTSTLSPAGNTQEERRMQRGGEGVVNWQIAVGRDAGGMLVGGLIAGGLGVAWLWSTGAWGPFWDVAINWNPEYFASRQNRWSLERMATLYAWLAPWWLAHLAAVPIAVARLIRHSLPSRPERGAGGEGTCRDALTAAFYLGWMMQVMLLQHPLLYIHASGVLIAVAIAADAVVRRLQTRHQYRTLFGAGVAFVVLTSPALQLDRLGNWWNSLRLGPAETVQDSLQRSRIVDHTQLRPVVEFLRGQGLQDGELTVYSGYLVGLYRQLDLAPSTRFVLLDVEARVFPSRAEEIANELDRSPQRFVVTNLLESGCNPDELSDKVQSLAPQLPDGFPAEHLAEFPFNQRLVFRSGPYLVHEVVAPVGSITTDYLPLAD